MSFIIKQLDTFGYNCFVYTYDMVIYSQNITSLNDALEALDIILLSSFFSIASEKCKALIFTRRRYNNCPNITIKGYTIPFVNNY